MLRRRVLLAFLLLHHNVLPLLNVLLLPPQHLLRVRLRLSKRNC
jgi:hypothetical protein